MFIEESTLWILSPSGIVTSQQGNGLQPTAGIKPCNSHFLNRKNILEQGSLQANPTPLVRVAPNTGEMNQWVLKQTLDHGVYGVLLPKVESVEAAKAAVLACRYPQKRGADHPWGERGWSPGAAARYWGLTVSEYYEAAGLWPLDPDGEIFLMAICESARGVQNLPDILREVQGIGGVLAGPGDLSVSMGAAGNPQDPEVQEALLSILKTCKQYGVPCGAVSCNPQMNWTVRWSRATNSS